MQIHTEQMSDSFRIGAVLALVGGFLDAYTYLCRGQVFANAQTGNIVFLGIYLADGNWEKVFVYLIPIFAFVVGVITDEGIKKYLDGRLSLHWRQIVLLIEMAVLILVFFIPLNTGDTIANALVSFICSLQAQSFRKVHGLPYATTMCTGNLRSGTNYLANFLQTRDMTSLNKCFKYYGIIAFFILGAGIGCVSVKQYGNLSLLFCFVLLAIAFFMLFIKVRSKSI